MPTNQQRISAIATTAVIVFAGGWLASIVSPTTGHETISAKAVHSTYKKAQENQRKGSLEQTAVSVKTIADNSNPGISMKVTIGSVRNNRGKIYVALFDDASAFDNYDYAQAIDYRELPARAGSISVDFSNLEDKPYAVSLFHDENGNQQFDTINEYPLEGYGTSRATSAYEELKFHRASIRPGPVNIKIFYTN